MNSCMRDSNETRWPGISTTPVSAVSCFFLFCQKRRGQTRSSRMVEGSIPTGSGGDGGLIMLRTLMFTKDQRFGILEPHVNLSLGYWCSCPGCLLGASVAQWPPTEGSPARSWPDAHNFQQIVSRIFAKSSQSAVLPWPGRDLGPC